MDPLSIINKYFSKDSVARDYLIVHGEMVASKAIEIAHNNLHLNPDLIFQ